MKLSEYRKNIDLIDAEIFALLEKRFSVCEEIGKEKRALGIHTEDALREKEILESIPKTKYESNIKEIYKAVFSQSKFLQQSGNEK